MNFGLDPMITDRVCAHTWHLNFNLICLLYISAGRWKKMFRLPMLHFRIIFLLSITEGLLESFRIRTLWFDESGMEFSLVDLRADLRFVSDPKSTDSFR